MVVTIEEQNKTLEYQETMNLDIENIAIKNQPMWRSIYEVIDDSYFGVIKLFPKICLNQCKNNPNEPQNIPSEFKADFKTMAMENGLYAQVVMILRRESDDKKEKDKTHKYNFQGQSTRIKLWFEPDHECLKEKFITR